MKTATCKLKSVSTYSQGAFITEIRPDNEIAADFEKRTWKQRCHVNDEGQCFIPPMVFKNCLSNAAKYMGLKIPGEGQNLYTKHIVSGVLVVEPLPLGVHIDDVQHKWQHVPSTGQRGGTKRVLKCFPIFPKWEGTVEYLIFDEKITKEVFTKILHGAGQFIGIGVFRPMNNGYYGRFSVEYIQWK